MGAYAYCLHEDCGLPLGKPTLRQAMGLEPWQCGCYHSRELIEGEKETIVGEFETLSERIQKIEDHLWPDHGYE